MNWNKDTLLGRVESGDYSELKSDLEQVVGKKICNRIKAKQDSILNRINGINEEKEDNELDNVMSKIANGQSLSADDKKVLSAVIDSAKGDDGDSSVDGEVLDKIMRKVSKGEELTDAEQDALEAALEVSDAYDKKKKK